MAKLKVPTKKLTYEEFLQLQWCDMDTWAEWVDGEVIVLTPASTRHWLIKKFLVGILNAYVQHHDLGTVLDSPFQMKNGPDLPGRKPVVFFVAKEHLDRLKETHLDGPADFLVIEVTSFESRLRNRGEESPSMSWSSTKRILACLFHMDEQRIDFYRLGADRC